MKNIKHRWMLLLLILSGILIGCGQTTATTDTSSTENIISYKITGDDKTQKIHELSTEDCIANQTFSNYKEAFYYVIKQESLEGYDDLGYNLIYFDEDDIPELVTGLNNYYISLYTYKDGMLYRPIDSWSYNISGNVGYEYVPYQNSLRYNNTEYAGAIHYTTYSTMNDQYFIDIVNEVKIVNFDDVNENGILDPEEESFLGINGASYLNGEKVPYIECEKCDVGEYEFIRPILSAEELLRKIEH